MNLDIQVIIISIILLVVRSKEKVLAICIVLKYFEEHRLDVYFVGVRGIDFVSLRREKVTSGINLLSARRRKEKKERKEEGKRGKGHERNDQRDNRGGMNRRVQ